jgi:hypothetical protein
MGGSNFNNNSRSKNSDYIQGDIHINGGLHSTGNTQITGDVDVTGGYTGNNPDGTMTNGAARIEPPDLSLMEYRAKSREANSWFIESCANHFAVGSNEWTYSASGKHSKDHGPSPTESGYPEEETNPSYTSEQQAHYTKGGSYAGGDLNNWPAGTLRDSATANPPSFLSYGPFSDSTNNPDGKNNEYDSSGSNDRNSNQYFWQDNFDEFTNGNFHFGYGADGRDSDGEDKIDFSSVAGPDGIYGNDDDITFFFIRGNVWLDTRGQLDFLFPDDIPAGQTLPPITVVIEGNLYIGDGMTYANDTDALMFIVKESDFHDENFMDDDRNGLFDFDDANNNGVQDGDEAGEEPYKTADGIWVPAGTAPDDADGGNGVLPYRGPKEGQGNVYFGDLKAAYGGTTAGFIFAENNVYMVADNPDIYGVEGFLNAGGTINMGQRQAGNNYVEYRVRYDDRIETGEIEFNGMPKNQNDNGEDKLSKVTWREVVPQ